MSTNKPRQLIEHISDQYVLSAVNPEQAFAREAEKRKKNHTKILAIACATAAVYVLIIVSILIGTRPDNPSVGPTPGTSTEPDIKIPSYSFFSKQLSGYWTPYDDTEQASATYTSNDKIFGFQADGRVYMLDPTTSTGIIGKYSLTGTDISIWTQEQGVWAESDIRVQVVSNESPLGAVSTEMSVTIDGNTRTYYRHHDSDDHISLTERNEKGANTLYEYWINFVEQITLIDSASPITFELPNLAYFGTLPVQTYDTTPNIYLPTVSMATYKLYDTNLKLIGEGKVYIPQGDLPNDSHTIFPDEPGRYYLDLAVETHETSSLFTTHITHYFAAIEICEPEPEEPDTPLPLPELDVNLPDAEFFQKHLSGFWEPNTYVSQPYAGTNVPYCVLNFQSDGRVYVLELTNANSPDKYTPNKDCLLGKYSIIDDFIQIYALNEEREWVEYAKVKIDVQSQQTVLRAGDWVFERAGNEGDNVTKIQISGTHQSLPKEISVWDFYIETAITANSVSHFDSPSKEHLKQLAPITFDSAPVFSISWINNANPFGHGVYCNIYDEDWNEIRVKACSVDPVDHSLDISFPKEDGLYYVRIMCFHKTNLINESRLIYYIPIRIGESEPDEPVTPPTYAEPEINLPSAELFSKHLSAFWTPNMPEGYPLTYLFDFQYDGRVHIVDMNEKTATVGRYSVEGDDIILWTLTEGVGWEKSDISVKLVVGEPPTKTKLLVTYDGTTERFVRLNGLSSDSLNIYNSTARPIEVDGAHLYHIEEMAFFGNDPIRFELPTLDVFKEADVVRLSHAPTYLRFSHQHSAEYRVYDKDMNLIADGECRTWPDQTDIPEIDFPEENGRYYLEVIATEEPSGTYYSYLVKHYYAVVEIGEVDEAGEQTDSYTPPAATTDPILIENCDTQPKGAFELDTISPVEGEGCWSITTPAAGALAFHAWENGIDASGCDVIEFDLYISDLAALEAMKKNCALELSSSETCDYQEIAFSGEQIVEFGRYGQEWQVGWNHIVLRIADATATNGPGSGSGKEAASFDISNVNFVRFYLLSATTSHTIKIDNICLSKEVK